MENEVNPYAAPQAARMAMPVVDASSIRRQLLGTESSLRGLGVVFVGGGALVVTAAYLKLDMSLETLAKTSQWHRADGLLTGVLTIACGLGLERLKRWAWMGCIIFSLFYMALAMSGFVSHWLLSLAVYGMVLAALLSTRARYVMAGGYREIMSLTPDVKSRMPQWSLGLAGFFFFGIAWALRWSGRL